MLADNTMYITGLSLSPVLGVNFAICVWVCEKG